MPRRGDASRRCNTVSMTAAMPVKFKRWSRKACTATSLAAFSTAAPCRRRGPPHAQAETGKRAPVGRLEIQASDCAQIKGFYTGRDALRPCQRLGDGRAHVGRCQAAPASNRRHTRPASARCSADAPPPRRCDSACRTTASASMSSSPLFISVAESTEILRPMLPFADARRPRRASPMPGARRRQAQERPARGGEADAADARARAPPGRKSAGRH